MKSWRVKAVNEVADVLSHVADALNVLTLQWKLLAKTFLYMVLFIKLRLVNRIFELANARDVKPLNWKLWFYGTLVTRQQESKQRQFESKKLTLHFGSENILKG